MYNLKKENTKVEVELSIDSTEWEKGVEKVYETSKSKFNVEGFRKGHVPRKVIEKTYGDGVFFEDTIEYFVNKTMNDVLNEHPELEPVSMPTTQFESFTIENGLKMKILFEIVPDFTLCPYKGQTFKIHENKATDKDVEHQIHHLLEESAKFEAVERESKEGDSVLIDFEGFIDDVAFEGGAGKNYPLELGSHTFIDNFEDQLVGHKKGDNVDVNVTFPENYGAEQFAGKKALFKVTINEVREKTLPDFDDKFVSDSTEYDNVEAYKKGELAHIQSMKDKDQENEIQYVIREYLVKNTEVQIPDVMIENAVHEDMHRMEDALKAYGITLEDYLKQTGSTLEDYVKGAKERTQLATKTRFIYRKLIETENIEVSAQELAENTKGMTDRNQVIRRENELLLDKLHKFLKENNKFEYIKD